MPAPPRFHRAPDPVIQPLCKEFGQTDEITTQDFRESQRFNPYKSVAPELARSKGVTDKFVQLDPDNTKELRASLQDRLHALELQRMEIERQVNEEKLGHQEGNVALREIGALVAEVTTKLNSLENEQALLNRHLHDLKAKNEELAAQLRKHKNEESGAEKKALELGERKVELARQLAEVTQEHKNQVRFLAEMAARRESYEEALAHVTQDSERIALMQRDLADKRRELEKALRKYKVDEKETEKRIDRHGKARSEKHSALKTLLGEISKLQGQINDTLPRPTSELVKPGVDPLPLSAAPPTTLAATPFKKLDVSAHSILPRDYRKSRTAAPPDIEIPQVPRGVYEESTTCCVPIPKTPPAHKDDTYYSCMATKDFVRERRDPNARPSTGARTRYVGLNTYNAGATLNMGTGMRRPGTGQLPFPSTQVPGQMDTTYGYYFGREGVTTSSGKLPSMALSQRQ